MVTKSLSPEANINLFKPAKAFPREINLAEKAVNLSSIFTAQYITQYSNAFDEIELVRYYIYNSTFSLGAGSVKLF